MLGHKDNDQDVAIIDHSVLNDTSMSEEERNKCLESSGNCLVNRSCQLGWIQTPLPPSMYPSVKNTVTVIPRESDIIYSEKGAVIGRREQVDTDSLLTDSLQPGSDFEEISLNLQETTPSTPSTVYRVCDNKNVDKITVTPLINQDLNVTQKSMVTNNIRLLGLVK